MNAGEPARTAVEKALHTPQAEAEMWARQEAVLAHFGDQGLSQRRYEPHDESL